MTSTAMHTLVVSGGILVPAVLALVLSWRRAKHSRLQVDLPHGTCDEPITVCSCVKSGAQIHLGIIFVPGRCSASRRYSALWITSRPRRRGCSFHSSESSQSLNHRSRNDRTNRSVPNGNSSAAKSSSIARSTVGKYCSIATRAWLRPGGYCGHTGIFGRNAGVSLSRPPEQRTFETRSARFREDHSPTEPA